MEEMKCDIAGGFGQSLAQELMPEDPVRFQKRRMSVLDLLWNVVHVIRDREGESKTKLVRKTI